jgi:hypothetical protein
MAPLRLRLGDEARVSRDGLMAGLRDRGIGTGLHFRAVHLQRYYRDAFAVRPGELSNTGVELEPPVLPAVVSGHAYDRRRPCRRRGRSRPARVNAYHGTIRMGGPTLESHGREISSIAPYFGTSLVVVAFVIARRRGARLVELMPPLATLGFVLCVSSCCR